jgi:phage gp45-like
MWLLHYITNRSLEAPAAVKGALSTGASGGAAVSSFEEHKELEFCFPYGLVSAAPEGERAVVLPLRDGETGLGVLRGDSGLEPGEVMLYSKGGASIVLKNDGRVLINGREVGNG